MFCFFFFASLCFFFFFFFFFFFSSRRRHTRFSRDWSSDVCSSDLDNEYGFPVDDDDALFERLVLEINQAGLSWLTILKKRAAFRDAFANFDIEIGRASCRERV